MPDDRKRGGKREGAGRPKGSLNKRSIEAIEAVVAKYPDWTPLLHFATVANDTSMPADIRLDAAKAAAPFFHPRPKSVELDPDALVTLEGRIAAARASATLKETGEHLGGLGDRLLRAMARADDLLPSVTVVDRGD
ncbi:hypothetical protein V5F59_14565 [Xanthobacter autotrophicus DSM 431]|uniref:hypothetical protein n=1 Tax=Xanthobacter nonsaccharivorans TaxID=3119912 RepID=UPI00372AA6EB